MSLANIKIRKFPAADQEKINGWLKDYTALLNLSTLTRVDARERVLASIGADPIRTYLLELSIAFYAYGGETDDFEERLVNSLAAGLRFEGADPTLCELPQEVLVSGPLANFPRSNLPSFALRVLRALRVTQEVTLHEYLMSNRHMQMVVLLAMADDHVGPNPQE